LNVLQNILLNKVEDF